ncbi:glycosyltransferase [bacterium]|nr:glycosyltransferase [bacterium]
MPKVTVLMSVYNTEENFLREAIESILNQTFKDFEFLIINDGSTNNAEEIIKSYNDSRIRYVLNEKNLRLIASLNKGLDLAQGEYIARFDSDDISRPERLEKQVKFMDDHPSVGLLGTQYQSFPKKRISDGLTDNKLIKESLLVQSNQLGHPTVMMRTSVLREHNLKYDKDALHVEDYKLWLDMSEVTDIANLDEILLDYRRHGGSICSNNAVKQNINVQKIMFSAQAKHFGLDASKQLKTVENLLNNQKISTEDLKNILDFVEAVKSKMQQQNYSIEYRLNHQFAKFALKKCRKTLKFLKMRLSGELKPFYEK